MDTHAQVVKAMQQLLKNPDLCVNVCWEIAANCPVYFLQAVDEVCPDIKEASLPLVERVRKLAYSLPRSDSSVGKVEFIKAHRQLTKMGLKESKDWVEANWAEFGPRC